MVKHVGIKCPSVMQYHLPTDMYVCTCTKCNWQFYKVYMYTTFSWTLPTGTKNFRNHLPLGKIWRWEQHKGGSYFTTIPLCINMIIRTTVHALNCSVNYHTDCLHAVTKFDLQLLINALWWHNRIIRSMDHCAPCENLMCMLRYI